MALDFHVHVHRDPNTKRIVVETTSSFPDDVDETRDLTVAMTRTTVALVEGMVAAVDAETAPKPAPRRL